MKLRNTRQQILDAVQSLIETEGFMGLTTKEIARKAGCAEGTIFKHFKRKEDLCLAVVLENSPKFKETIAGKRAGTGSVARNLEDIALAAIRFSDKLIPLAVSLFADADLLARHRQAMRESGKGPKDVFERVAAYVEGEQHIGRLNPKVTPESAAALLLGPCFQRAFIRQAMGKDLLAIKDQDFVSALVATLMHGLSVSHGGEGDAKGSRSRR
jgi:AcrR family transcriptional regulator